jgi:hypothetical protein
VFDSIDIFAITRYNTFKFIDGFSVECIISKYEVHFLAVISFLSYVLFFGIKELLLGQLDENIAIYLDTFILVAEIMMKT